MTTTLKLQSMDDQEFEVTRATMACSTTITTMLEDLGDAAGVVIPLPNVSGAVLAKIIAYARHHADASAADTSSSSKPAADKPAADKPAGVSEWDREFCRVEQAMLFELILAANYLDIKPLLELTCRTVADMIKGKSPEEIRQTFNIENDFTPEEEELVRKENEWCEER